MVFARSILASSCTLIVSDSCFFNLMTSSFLIQLDKIIIDNTKQKQVGLVTVYILYLVLFSVDSCLV